MSFSDEDQIVTKNLYAFTARHGMQTRSSDENSVCPSVSLSNAWIVTKRKKDLFRLVGKGDPFYPKFWVNLPPLERNSRFSVDTRS